MHKFVTIYMDDMDSEHHSLIQELRIGATYNYKNTYIGNYLNIHK